MKMKQMMIISALCGAILLTSCGTAATTGDTTVEPTTAATTTEDGTTAAETTAAGTTETTAAGTTAVPETETTAVESGANLKRLEPVYAAEAFDTSDSAEVTRCLAFGMTAAEVAIVRGLARLAERALPELAAASPDENVVFSTPSLALALGMLAQGAEGATREELLTALDQPEDGDWMASLIAALNVSWEEEDLPELTIESSRALWLQDGYRLRAEYGEMASRVWHADINVWAPGERDAAHETIGQWYEEKSHGLLPASTVPDDLPNEGTSLILLDALYYKAQWLESFDARGTEADIFRLADGEVVPVLMMLKQLQAQRALVRDDYQIAQLPMAGGYQFVVALPTGERGADELLADKDFRRDFMASSMSTKEYDIMWQLPKLDLALGADLLPLLPKLGVTTAMSAEADFGALFEDARPGDFVLDVLRQDARLLLDEDGVEAAAVTLAAVKATAMPSVCETLEMRLDRPFIAEIRSEGGLPLFSMVVRDPGVRP
ncbi:MAG: serpin family protein [Bacillota bacterium]|nr:serpin family protein [Bacillota bacterium]